MLPRLGRSHAGKLLAKRPKSVRVFAARPDKPRRSQEMHDPFRTRSPFPPRTRLAQPVPAYYLKCSGIKLGCALAWASTGFHSFANARRPTGFGQGLQVAFDVISWDVSVIPLGKAFGLGHLVAPNYRPHARLTT